MRKLRNSLCTSAFVLWGSFTLLADPGRALMSTVLSLCATLGLVVLLTGCDPTQTKRPEETEDLEERVAYLEEQLLKVSEELEAADASLFDDIYSYHLDDVESTAVLNCSEPSYSWLRYRALVFPVLCEDAQPFLDGFKLQLSIGNPYSATFSDVALEVVWGAGPFEKSLFPELYPEDMKKRTKTVTYGEPLRSGTWNKLPLVLSPATPDEAGHVSISLSVGTVQLATP